MKTDIFTKALLTVIAVNLSILVFTKLEIIPKAHAQADSSRFEDAEQAEYGLVPLNDDGTISVRIEDADEYALLNVNLKYVDMYRTRGSIDVDIKDISTSKKLGVDIAEISTHDDMEVDISDISTSLDLNVYCLNCD
mgnify:CR=1 FL=1